MGEETLKILILGAVQERNVYFFIWCAFYYSVVSVPKFDIYIDTIPLGMDVRFAIKLNQGCYFQRTEI